MNQTQKRPKSTGAGSGGTKASLVCELCQKRLPNTRKYEEHMNNHSGRKFHCGFCGKPFKSKEFLEYHELEHKGVYKFRCSFCQKGYNHHGNFARHEQVHARRDA